LAGETPPLPPGFTLDSQAQAQTPPLPPGFTLDQQASQPETPGFFDRTVAGAGVNFPAATAGVELAAHAATGSIAPVIGGLAGIGAAAGRAMGLTDAQPGDVTRNVSEALTYQPRSAGGQVAAKIAGFTPRLIEKGANKAGEFVTDTTGSPALGAATNTALQMAPALLLRGKAGEVLGDVSRSTPANRSPAPRTGEAALPATAERSGGLAPVSEKSTIQIANEAGYKLKPSEAGGKGGSIAEGLSGSAKLEVAALIKNQQVTNRLAAEEIGLPANARVTPKTISAAKAPHNKVYAEVGNKLGEVPTDATYAAEVQSIGRNPGTSFKKATNGEVEALKQSYIEDRFNAADAVLETRTLRAAARKNIRSPDPAKNELGHAQLKVSDTIEGQMERYGQSIGQKDLIARFQKARQRLAVINSVERSFKNGNVDASLLAKQMDAKAPLSGNLKTIAQVASEFPKVMRNAARVPQQSSVNMFETVAGVGGAMATGNAAMLGAMAVRPLTRAVLMSDRYQRGLVPKANRLAEHAAEKPKHRNALATS